MYTIDQKFIGGNIEVLELSNSKAVVQRELRDTGEEWFNWAFRVKGAEGTTINFDITQDYIGKFGPCVSQDNRHWKWLNDRDSQHQFTYKFKDDEDCVYFAHHALYNPDRFYDFCKGTGLEPKILCKSKKGRDIPYLEFGSGDEYVILVSRHHACEATGSYVLEGLLDYLVKNPIANLKILCIPFMDFDGVCDGDQGKSRLPHDHNQDYNPANQAIYETVSFLREFAKTHKIKYAFDLHSPWHEGGENDFAFIPIKNYKQMNDIVHFSNILEKNTQGDTLRHYTKNNHLPDVGWNKSASFCYGTYMCHIAKSILSFTLETCYFGLDDNKFTTESGVVLGHKFAETIKDFDDEIQKQ